MTRDGRTLLDDVLIGVALGVAIIVVCFLLVLLGLAAFA